MQFAHQRDCILITFPYLATREWLQKGNLPIDEVHRQNMGTRQWRISDRGAARDEVGQLQLVPRSEPKRLTFHYGN
jgi:hypothetical protein